MSDHEDVGPDATGRELASLIIRGVQPLVYAVDAIVDQLERGGTPDPVQLARIRELLGLMRQTD